MAPRFDIYRQESPANCSEPDWECVRATGYEYVGSTFTDAQAAFYQGLGFEVALHLNTNCVDWTPATLETFFSGQLATFGAAFPSVPLPSTNRTHCIAYSDWSTEPETELRHGIRFDTNYYYWPPTWVNDRPGMFTGSGIPMRFAKLDGSLIDCYQVATQMTDESGQTYPKTSDSLLARALDARGYYGVFCANMHFDTSPNPASDAVVASAVARGIPVVSSSQMLAWLDGRNGSAFGDIAWNAGILGFSISVAGGARNLQAMLPMLASTGSLTGLSRNGFPVTYTTRTIKGMDYAFFPADSGSYVANYLPDGTPPLIGTVLASPAAGGGETITWTTNEASTSRVDYGTSPASLTLNASSGSLVGSHSITLAGLSAGTTYYFRVTSADVSGNSATSPASPGPPLEFTRPTNAPPQAVATATPPGGQAPLVVGFSGASSTDADNDSLTFAWDFGDGATGSGRLANHTYATPGTYPAVLTASDGQGGTDTTSVLVWVTAPSAFPEGPVLDNFDRANGPLGGSWTTTTPGLAVQGNTLLVSQDASATWNAATFGANQECYVTLTAPMATATEIDLMLKVQGPDGNSPHIEAWYDGTGHAVHLSTFDTIAGWISQGGLTGVTFGAGDQFGIRAYSTGVVVVFRNGVSVGSVTLAGWLEPTVGGRIGMTYIGAAGTRADDFGGGDWTPVLPLGVPDAHPSLRLALRATPSPFVGALRLSLSLPQASDVTLVVMDLSGRVVAKAPRRALPVGQHVLSWDGRDLSGHDAGAGVFWAVVHAGDRRVVRRVVRLR
jgi:hypothetical protein